MDKLIIEFNKKFDKQKQELIDGFKALGEEKRLPKALATIEGEQPTYKNYFKAGWQSRQPELVDKDQRIHELNETSLDLEGQIYKLQEQLNEKDKRIEKATAKWISIVTILTTTDTDVPDVIFKQLDQLHDALCCMNEIGDNNANS